jgi:hypothetical protein
VYHDIVNEKERKLEKVKKGVAYKGMLYFKRNANLDAGHICYDL